MPRRVLTALLALAALAAGASPAVAATRDGDRKRSADVRFATFNASLNRGAAGQLVTDLSNPSADTVGVRQARNVAEVIQRARPDVVLVNEFDFYEDGSAARLFRDNFLRVSQNGAPAADYPHFFVAPSNTGVPSGFDLDNSGDTNPNDSGNDAFGFGLFPGQFGMVVYSKHPIDRRKARTFQTFLWKDMPGARLPDNASTPQPGDYYSAEELAVFRLSSKSHWDVPIRVGRRTVHLLASHPTPPVFDGLEDRGLGTGLGIAAFVLGLLALLRGWTVQHETTRRIVRESFPVLLIAIILDILAGTVVEPRIENVLAFPALLLVIPGFLEKTGALGAILAARLGSKLHLGAVTPRARPDAAALLDGSIVLVLGFVSYAVISITTLIVAELLGIAYPGVLRFIGIVMTGGILATLIAAVIGYYAATTTYRFGFDPDNHTIPLVTSGMDLLGVICLVVALALFGVA